jgi:uncharacterized protein with NAD-binding domain and iron-sulfur cluster
VTEKVAVLGGGMAALTAAFELARLKKPDGAPRYEITVYQMGWRLGGKGASGVNASKNGRIEEHGLHIWFGSYENAFRVMRAVYGQTATLWPKGEIATAFTRQDEFHLVEKRDGGWLPWKFVFAGDAAVEPGDASPPIDCSPRELFNRIRDFIARYFDAHVRRAIAQVPALQPLAEAAMRSVEAAVSQERPTVLFMPTFLSFKYDLAAKELGALARASMRMSGLAATAGFLDDIRRAATILAIVTAIVAGLLRSSVFDRNDWDELNAHDLRTWVKSKMRFMFADFSGLADSEFVTAIYDLYFSYVRGDDARESLEAGTALRAGAWLAFGYKGSFMWRMNAGMGDAIFAPLYNALSSMGVKFRFFHRVLGLHLSNDKTHVAGISLHRQADVKNGAEYRPFVTQHGHDCWPDRPNACQLERVEDDLEGGLGEATTDETLRAGVDFHKVVLGIPLGAHQRVIADLHDDTANPALKTMFEKVFTVPTLAAQVWLDKDLAGLGPHFSRMPILTTFLNPLDTYADMSHVLDAEGWTPATRPKHLAYFCGVLEEVQQDVDHRSRARAFALGLLQEQARAAAPMASLWPGAYVNGKFDWNVMRGSGAADAQRFEHQYWRANTAPSDRYVIAAADTSRHRVPAQSAYGNLVLAGDWTRNGLFVGCIEGAVISGKQAARAIAGDNAGIEIIGEGTLFKRPA